MKNRITIFLLTLSLGLTYNCTDLEEEVLDESLTGGAGQNDIIEGSLVPAYAPLPEFFRHTRYFALQEISTDEAILPYRGGTDWGDNNIYIDLHRHTYTPSHDNVNQCWEYLTSRMSSRVATAINVLQPLAENGDTKARAFLVEARALGAYYNMVTLDLFGLIFVKDSENPDENSIILRGAEAVAHIESEFLAVENELPTDIGPGRISQTGAQALLARLYLNKAVWSDPYGTPAFDAADMDKVIEYSNKVINSGKYALSAEFFEIFDDENHDNPELIFAVDQRADLNGHNRMAYFSMSGNLYPNPQFPEANGTDGPGITSDYYQTWEQAYAPIDPANADARFFKENLIIPADSCIAGDDFEINRGIYRGQQYGLLSEENGQPFERCSDGSYRIGKLRNNGRAIASLVDHTEFIDFSPAGSDYSTGFRVEKYEFSKKSDSGRNKGEADLIIVRLADVYLMRAEALMRKGDAAGALADVNFIRASRTARPELVPPSLQEMTIDILYRERGFEFYWEHQRRTDMIRFGKYEDSWTEKSDTDVNKRVFPIPQTAIDGASIEPGYLVQNPGY